MINSSQAFIDKINSPEYGVWFSMIKRCHDHNNKYYCNYGGRGISVCDRWLGFDGFDNFIEDMGHRPSKNLSLDRIDNNGNYCPSNCRWATAKQQAQNRRSNRLITIDGNEKSVAEWADISGISQRTIRDRLDSGWDPKKAVFTNTRSEVKIVIGEKFGKWTIIRNDCEKVKSGSARCTVQCDCGNISTIRFYDLKVGKTTQCKSCCMKGNFYAKKVQ